MKVSLSLWISVLSLFSVPTHAQSFCHDWASAQQAKTKHSSKISFGKQVGFLLRYEVAPGSFLKAIAVDGSPIRRFNDDTSVSILSVGTMADEERSERIQAYERAMKTFQSERKKLSRLLKGLHTEDQCKQAVQGGHFDVEAYRALADYLQTERQAAGDVENAAIQSSIHRQLRKRISSIEGTTLERIQGALKSSESGTVVLVLHASDDGRLYDSNWNQIPKSIFRNLSSKIKQLVIYACHAEKVAEYYQLAALKSEHSVQVVIPKVNPKIQWLLGDSVPSVFLKRFLKKVISLSRIRDKSMPTALSSSLSPTTIPCQMRFELGGLQDGELAVFVNRIYVGHISATSRELTYDCALTTGRAVLTLQNINLYHAVQVDQRATEWQVDFAGRVRTILNSFTPNGHYVGSKTNSVGDRDGV